jgi:betaine-aldehyde dehydrogenase
MMAIWKIAAGARRRQHRRAQASRHHAGVSTLLLAEIAPEFLPPGVLNVVCGDRDTGRAGRAPDPADGLDHRLGPRRHGGRAAARPDLKRCTSSSAARRRSSSSTTPTSPRPPRASPVAGYFNAGQDCTAATRVLAAPGIHDDFVAALTEQAKAIADRPARRRGRALRPAQQRQPARRGSPAWSTGCPTTRVLTGGHRRRRPVGRLLLRADRGLRPQAGRRDGPGRDLRPGHHRAAVHRRGRGAALGQRRRVRPGLQRLDQGPRPAMRMSKRLDFGCVWINTHIPLVAEMPHGGFKHSGYGKDLSMYGLEDYTRIKHVIRRGRARRLRRRSGCTARWFRPGARPTAR